MFSLKISDEVELRLLEERHAEEYFGLLDGSREFLKKWQPQLDAMKNIDHARQSIRYNLEKYARNDGFVVGIWYESKLAGIISFNEIKWLQRNARIGYWLGESFQGKGLVIRACRAMINYAFQELKLNRIELDTAVDNLRSQAVAEKLGFVREGVMRQKYLIREQFVDAALYSLLAAEWHNK